MSNDQKPKKDEFHIELTEQGKKARAKRQSKSAISCIIALIAILLVCVLFSNGFAHGVVNFGNIVAAIFKSPAGLVFGLFGIGGVLYVASKFL